MNIQSLSIMVPCGGHCMNNCKFCVSRMRDDESIFGKEIISATNIPQSYIDRIKYVRDAGCDNMIITGTTEPQQNMEFIKVLLWKINKNLPKPFYNIAIQTQQEYFGLHAFLWAKILLLYISLLISYNFL